MGFLREGVRALGEVIADAARALARHWPVLVVLYLGGATLRMGFLWLASWVSDRSSTLGVLIVPLATLATLVALVAMIRVAGESLPAFRGDLAAGSRADRARTHWTVATGVLIPFLAVYSAQGLLREDTVQFIHDTTLDEAVSQPLTADYSRALIASGWQLVAVVLVSLVLRRVIAGYGLGARSWRWAAIGGYVEALWMVTVAASIASRRQELTEWVGSRLVVATLSDWWEGLVGIAGPLAKPLLAVRDAIAALLGAMGDLVIVPVAWLAIGALIYGHRLSAPQGPHVGDLGRQPAQLAQLAQRLPSRVRSAAATVVDPLAKPVRSTVGALGKVAAAGVIPMVLVCLTLVAAGVSQLGVVWAAREVLGPQEALRGAAYQPYVSLVARGVYFIVAAVLLAAAVNRIVTAIRSNHPAEVPSAQESAEA